MDAERVMVRLETTDLDDNMDFSTHLAGLTLAHLSLSLLSYFKSLLLLEHGDESDLFTGRPVTSSGPSLGMIDYMRACEEQKRQAVRTGNRQRREDYCPMGRGQWTSDLVTRRSK